MSVDPSEIQFSRIAAICARTMYMQVRRCPIRSILRSIPCLISSSSLCASLSLFHSSTRLRISGSLEKPHRMSIPPGAWDSHMHVVDPARNPLAPGALYVPSPHTLSDALAFESRLGFRNIVIVQPSIYGDDNSCLLDALESLGPERGRGVVGVDPQTVTATTLQTWHAKGVRGVRLNLKSTGQTMEASVFEGLLRKYAERIAPLGWVLQLYVSMEMLDILEGIVPNLGVKVCLDHFAGPSLPAVHQSPLTVDQSPSTVQQSPPAATDPYDLPGFKSLISLLRQGSTYVKVSGAYRISSDAELRDLQPMAEELLRVAGSSRLVFATDWPHTRFEGLDIRPFVDKVMEWCKGDDELIERVFRGNAESLWDVDRQQAL